MRSRRLSSQRKFYKPKTRKHRRKISESLRAHYVRVRAALAQVQQQTSEVRRAD